METVSSPLTQVLKERRTQIKLVASLIKKDLDHPETSYANAEGYKEGIKNCDEIKENIILAYRHLEDASMRLGKAIQAYDGGKSAAEDAVSIYDK